MVLRNGGCLCAKGKASHTAAGCGRCILLCLLSSHLFLHKRKPFLGRTLLLPQQHAVLATPRPHEQGITQLRGVRSPLLSLVQSEPKQDGETGNLRPEWLVAMVPVPGRSQSAGEQKIKTILPGFQWNLCHLQPASYYTERYILSTSLLETSPTSLLSIPGQRRGCGLETWSRAEPVTRPFHPSPSPSRTSCPLC